MSTTLWSSRGGGFCGLGLQPLDSLVNVYHEAAMCSAADLVDPVLCRHRKGDAASLHGGDDDRDFDGHPEKRRRQMLDRDLRAHGILAGIGVLEQKIAAGPFDIKHQVRRTVDAARL